SNILQGHMVSWNYYQTTETEKNTAFVEAYKKKYGSSRVTSDPAEAAYDAVYLWKAACEKAGSFEVDDVIKAIEEGGISFDAPEGTVAINGENHHLSKPVRIGEVGSDGLIHEIYATEAVAPDPYLTTYDWAVAAGIQRVWGASLMWSADAVFEYAELGADCFSPLAQDMLNDTYLGLSVAALALIVWLITVFVKAPNKVLKSVFTK
ncbi:MAG: transporter substrate-binding protein, partial [Ruminococcus sp.]